VLTYFQKSLLATIALGALLIALVVAAKSPAQATTFAPAVQVPVSAVVPPGIVTTGDATVRVRPDSALVTVGAVAQAATAAEAQDLVAERIARVIERSKGLGIAEKDTRTSQYRIDPQYAYEQGKAPRLTGYQGTQQLALTLHGTEGVGKAIDALVQNDGALTATVSFMLLDSKAAQADARRQAIEDARAKAEAMAKTAGVTIGKIVSVNDVGLTPQVGSPSSTFTALAIPAPRAADTQLPTGQLDVVVRVQVQFEIG
jgi:hypothetical protein